MVSRIVLGRRLLLGSGITAAFLLPAARWEALARGKQAHGPRSHDQGAEPARRSAPADHRPRPLVMLDPGHGGKDPGAVGLSGTYEKHVSLAAAMELGRSLEVGGRYRVGMTRTRDVFVPLEERVARAQARGAALFVSLHADALPDHAVRGASVYTLSISPSDAQTAALARHENSVDRFGGAAFQDAPPEVARILASLVRQETRAGSARLARSLVRQFEPDVALLENPSRHAGFVVLKAADIPSVLVEMGFMSNPRDEAALRRPAHRARVAAAIRRAVDAYFAVGRAAGAPG